MYHHVVIIKGSKGSRTLSLLLWLLFAGPTACQTESGRSEVSQLPLGNANSITKPANTPEQIANEKPPITIGKVTKKPGKPPLQLYLFEIELKSPRDGYFWLLMPDDIDQPFSESGILANDGNTKMPFSSFAFPGQKQDKVVLISFFGKDDFHAVRLPVQGTIKFEQFLLYGRSDVSEIEIWEARSLLVNGKTPLEEWLPYDTASDPTTRAIKEQGDSRINLDLDQNKNTNSTRRTDYPKEEVKFVEAKGFRKWKIPFKISVEK